MDSLRLWILGAAAGSFIAGMVVGNLFPSALSAEAIVSPALAQAAELATRYALSSQQYRQLQLVLQDDHEREIQILRSAPGNQLPQPQMGEMLALHRRTEQRIRALLDGEQRARYDRDSRPPGGSPAVGDKR